MGLATSLHAHSSSSSLSFCTGVSNRERGKERERRGCSDILPQEIKGELQEGKVDEKEKKTSSIFLRFNFFSHPVSHDNAPPT